MPPVDFSPLVVRIQDAIEQAAKALDFGRVEQLSRYGNEVKAMIARVEEIERSIMPNNQPREAAIPDKSPDALPEVNREDSSVLAVSFKWPATYGQWAGQEERICERQASDTLVRFLNRIAEVMGQDRIAELAHIATGRGPLVSTNPKQDFRNHRGNTIYTHQGVQGTSWFVLTQSATKEKAGHIAKALRLLRIKGDVSLRDTSSRGAPGELNLARRPELSSDETKI